jgi:hypothetical protein
MRRREVVWSSQERSNGAAKPVYGRTVRGAVVEMVSTLSPLDFTGRWIESFDNATYSVSINVAPKLKLRPFMYVLKCLTFDVI